MNNPMLTNTPNSDSAWDRAANYVKEERSMRAVDRIVVKGALDVVFFRAATAHMVVAGENQEAIRGIKTRFDGTKLIIEQEGTSISVAGGSIHVSGSGNIVAGGNIYMGSRRGGVSMQFNGPVGGIATGAGRCIVGIALPEAPSIRLKGSGDITLYDLQQAVLDIAVKGAGDITAFGSVDHLEAEVAGAGNVDARKLIARTATLLVSGAGDVKAHVSEAVKARVSGCGDIVVRGNPAQRDKSVSGVGSIKFK